jgi:peptidoglycan/LPS O-acetylase OafA/YrhL
VGKSRRGWSYRPDIDALRGIAVLAVFIYHLNESWLPGGFTGVDVFFVVSGYVVTGSLQGHQGEPLLQQLGGFYLRRIRRLLPNLICAVGITSLAIAFLVPPSETRGMYTAAVKSLYGWSNNHFLQTATNYFGLDANLNPLSHTWSLGVEEQFYLVFPLLLALLGLAGRRALPLLLSLVLLSLAVSLWWTRESPIWAFFLMPSRFWELAAGAALLQAQGRGWLGGFEAGGRRRWLRWGGYGLLALALISTSASRSFPAPGALPAVLATLALLQAGSAGAIGVLPQRFLPWRWLERLLVACGLLSYSLYLWHWPVLSFMRWTTGVDRPWLYVVAVGLSFGFAWIAYVLVERPVRKRPLPALWQWLLSLVALGITWNGIEVLAHPYRGRLFLGSAADPVPKAEKIAEQRPVIAGTGISDASCGIATWTPYSAAVATDFQRCSKPGRAGAGEIFLIGDSHAHHLLPMLDAVTDRTGQQISFTFKSSCLISSELTVSFDRKPYEPCRQFAAGEIDRALQRLQPGDIVLVSTWLNKQLADIDSHGRPNDFPVFAGGKQLSPAQVRDRYVASTRRIAQRLAQHGIQLVLMVDVPSLAREPVVCEAWGSLVADREGGTFCSPKPLITSQMQNSLRQTLAKAAAGLPNVHVFDPTDSLLVQRRVQHRRQDGTLLYADGHHLSMSGSRSLAEPFLRFLQGQGLVVAGGHPG